VKVLLDQNISFRVVNAISSTYSEAKEVRELGLENASDGSKYPNQKDRTKLNIRYIPLHPKESPI
jgi:hypothetical protein